MTGPSAFRRSSRLDRTQTRRFNDDEKGVRSTHTPGGLQDVFHQRREDLEAKQAAAVNQLRLAFP